MTDPAFEPQENAALTTEPAPAKKRTGLIVLAVVLALLLGTTGTLGVLYANAKSRQDALTTQLSDLDRQQQDATKVQLESNDALKKARDAQRSAEQSQGNAETGLRIMVDCQQAARAMREADLTDAGDPVFQPAARKMISTC